MAIRKVDIGSGLVCSNIFVAGTYMRRVMVNLECCLFVFDAGWRGISGIYKEINRTRIHFHAHYGTVRASQISRKTRCIPTILVIIDKKSVLILHGLPMVFSWSTDVKARAVLINTFNFRAQTRLLNDICLLVCVSFASDKMSCVLPIRNISQNSCDWHSDYFDGTSQF
jgi:hypothetical protein